MPPRFSNKRFFCKGCGRYLRSAMLSYGNQQFCSSRCAASAAVEIAMEYPELWLCRYCGELGCGGKCADLVK